jgi:RNA polymerase sigma-70 factor (ECF subfamily)
VKPDFQPITWEAFQRFALDGCAPAVVANELGLNVHSVIQAKSRILKRLREEAGELLE